MNAVYSYRSVRYQYCGQGGAAARVVERHDVGVRYANGGLGYLAGVYYKVVASNTELPCIDEGCAIEGYSCNASDGYADWRGDDTAIADGCANR